jgi:voltage-gated potassium channel
MTLTATDDDSPEHRRPLADRIERASRLPMVLLSIVFLVAIALPEIAEIPPEFEETLEAINWLIWAIFAFELGTMTYLAADRRRYLLEHWVDVLTVCVPFLRPLRLLRIAIISARLWTEVRVLIYQRTFSTVAMTSIVSALVAATLVYAVERGGEGPIQTYPDALWWAAATVTTVGYGDVYPKTAAGRGIAFLLMLIGISVFGLLTARVAAIFVETAEDDGHQHAQKLDDVLARLERLEHLLASRHPAADTRPMPPSASSTDAPPAASSPHTPSPHTPSPHTPSPYTPSPHTPSTADKET